MTKVKIRRLVPSPLEDEVVDKRAVMARDKSIIDSLLSMSSKDREKETKEKKTKSKKKKKDKKKKSKKKKKDLIYTMDIYNENGGKPKDKNSEDFYEKRFNGSLVLLANLLTEVNEAMIENKDYLHDMRKGKVRSSPMAITSQMSNISSLLGSKLSVIKEITAVNTKISDLELKKSSADAKSSAKQEEQQNNSRFIMDQLFDRVVNSDVTIHTKDGSKPSKGKGGTKKSKKQIDDEINARISELEKDGEIEFTDNELAFKYERDGVRIQIQKNMQNDRWKFIAVNDNGDELYDYPVPNKKDVGRVEFDEYTMKAKDKLGNIYDVILEEYPDDGYDSLYDHEDSDDFYNG